MIIVRHTEFNKTKLTRAQVYFNGKPIDATTWDRIFWVSRPEEMYGLMSSRDRDVNILVIKGQDWSRGKAIETAGTETKFVRRTA